MFNRHPTRRFGDSVQEVQPEAEGRHRESPPPPVREEAG